MKSLVLYYSKTGNNRYLAQRCANELAADIEEIKPRLNVFPLQILFSLMKKSPGIARLSHDVTAYDRVILCGPIWMGHPASAIGSFLLRFSKNVKRLDFITCCGGGDDTKDEKFGYVSVFKMIEILSGGKNIRCEAFPVVLAVPEDKRKESDVVMKTRLNDDNFAGELQEKLDAFLAGIK